MVGLDPPERGSPSSPVQVKIKNYHKGLESLRRRPKALLQKSVFLEISSKYLKIITEADLEPSEGWLSKLKSPRVGRLDVNHRCLLWHLGTFSPRYVRHAEKIWHDLWKYLKMDEMCVCIDGDFHLGTLPCSRRKLPRWLKNTNKQHTKKTAQTEEVGGFELTREHCKLLQNTLYEGSWPWHWHPLPILVFHPRGWESPCDQNERCVPWCLHVGAGGDVVLPHLLWSCHVVPKPIIRGWRLWWLATDLCSLGPRATACW